MRLRTPAPLKFCGKGAMEIAGDVVEHWAVGTMGDAAAGMVTTYVSERFDGKSPQEAFQSTMSSADDILINAAVTSAAGTMFDAVTAPKCFVAGTMITTISGLRAIESIQAGDVVLAANEETGEVAYKEVVRTFVNTTDEITHVTVENAEGEQETIDSTPEHPFYVEGLGWVEASALHPGMTIWFANGTKGTVEDISNEGLEEPVTVYNFEVKDFHTYFVGECGVLVHNACDGSVVYGELDELGRTTGVEATITQDMIGTGTSAQSSIKPAGFGGQAEGHARGYLLGKQLGGSGSDERNLVTIYQNPVNHPVMSSVEATVRKAVENGETVNYKVTPIYEGTNLIPSGITVNAQGDGGLSINQTILNRQ